ncbi:MAG: hypothetical protein SGBAC_011828 [Bacillariaceae sp.]
MSAEEESTLPVAAPTDSNAPTGTSDVKEDGTPEDIDDNDNHKDIGFLQAKCSLLQNQLAFLRAQQKQKKEQRKKEKGEIVTTFKSMKGYIDHLEVENKQYKAVLEPTSVSEDEDELLVLRQRLLTMERENLNLKQRLSVQQSQCQELETSCNLLQQEISRSKTTEAQLRDQVLKYEQVVDHVPPSIRSNSNTNQIAHSASMSVMADDGSRSATIMDESSSLLYGGGGGGPGGAIGAIGDDSKEDLFGKMVDHTPITPGSRSRSGGTATKSSTSSILRGEDDTVFGVTDRAELASIADLDDEDDDDSDNDNNNEEEDDNAGGEEWAGSVMDNESNKILVDHLPPSLKQPKKRRNKGPSSVAAVRDVSGASGGRMNSLTLDDNTVGGDDDNLFGKMVDTTPDLTSPYAFRKTGSSVSFRDNLEDDTVVGVTEKLEIESVARQDDEVSSHGGDTGTVDGTVTIGDDDLTRDGMSIAGASQISFKLNVKEEKNLVDHVPHRRKPSSRQRDASVVAIADNYSTSSPKFDDDTIADGVAVPGQNNAFGPIVDLTPSVVAAGGAPSLRSSGNAKSVATSVVTQNSNFTDLNDDYGVSGDADTLGPASTVGDADWERESLSSSMREQQPKHMVDFVPKRKRVPTDLSVRVYMDHNTMNNDNMSQVDTIAEDEEMEYGPIVDQTPFSATKSVVSSTRSTSGQLSVAGSTMAVGGGDMTNFDYELDTVQDTFMDAVTIASIQEEEDNSTGDSAEEENVVDHVPSRRKMRSVDESIRVLVDANETMSQVDTIAEDGLLDDFGPIVDHTPQIGDITRSSSGVRSVAASTVAIADDNRTEGDLESMALHTTVTSDVVTINLADGEYLAPLAGTGGEEEKHLVDYVPIEEQKRPSEGGSVRVVLDTAETLSQVDTVAADEQLAFGPIVDHTPAFSARSVGRSVGASMLSVGSNDDSTSIQDNTTVGFGIGGSVGGGDDTGNLDDNTAPAYTPSANEDKQLVDHVPQSSVPSSGDVSVMVQADPLDAVFEVDDETSNGNVRTDRYCPIVDQTPLMSPSPTPPVPASMVTTTSDAAIDIRTDDGTWLSGSTERGDTLGEVNSRDTADLPVGDDSSSLKKTMASGQVMVETVQSYDSDDLTDDAYVRVAKADSIERGVVEDDGKQSIASDEEGGFDLKDMHNYAEELAAKTSESKDNPFDLDSDNPQSSPQKKVNPDVQDYIASLASGAQTTESSNSEMIQNYEDVKNYVADLANGNDSSVTGSVESSQEMQKYIADLASFTGIQGNAGGGGGGGEEIAGAKTFSSSDPHKADTPKKKGDTTSSSSGDDARNEILDEIATKKQSSVFGKLFRGNSKNQKGEQGGKQDGTWA